MPVVATAIVLSLRALPATAGPAATRDGDSRPRWDWAQPLRVPVFGAATAAVGLSNLAMYGTLLAVPVVLAGRPGWSAADAGLALAMLSLAMIAVAPFGGRLADRRGHRLPAAGGRALLTVCGAMLATMGAAPSPAGLGTALPLGGIGLGLANAALQTAAIESVHARHAGVAAGLFSSGRYAGSIVSALLLGALLGRGESHAAAFLHDHGGRRRGVRAAGPAPRRRARGRRGRRGHPALIAQRLPSTCSERISPRIRAGR